MSRRLLLLIPLTIVALLLLVAVGVLGGVSASPGKAQKKKANTTLTVMTKTREAGVVDLDPRGPSQGDLRVVNAPLYNASGTKKIGRLDLFCVLTDPADESDESAQMIECSYTYTLPGGEINAQGVSSFPDLAELRINDTDAVTGGTGKYVGVKGEVRLVTRGARVFTTFRFVN